MRLLNPAALALLLLLPILLLLYMLRARRQDVVVSATLLWRRAQVDLLATRPLRRLERSLLLLLQLLIVGLLVLAAARPLVPWPGGSGEALIVVMDVSASMQATDVPPSRFEAARRDALALVERLRPGEEGMIIAAGRAPEVAAVFTGDRRALARTLRALTVTDGEARVADALALAAAHRRGRAARIVAFTDGTEPVPPSVVAEVRRFGRSGDNVGIVAMRAAPGLRGETHVVIRVHNAGGAPRQVPLTVLADGRPVTTQRLALPAGETRGIALTLPPPAPARMQAVIEAADLLAADNIAYAAAERAPLPAVLLVTAGNPYLERVMEVLPVRRYARTNVVDPGAWGQYEVVILDRVPAVEVPPGNYLLVRTVPPNLPVTAEGTVPRAAFAWWRAAHPVLRFVDLADIQVGRTVALRPRGGEVLAAGALPLLWAYQGRGVRAIMLPFALEDSDLPVRPAFPLLMTAALAWLAAMPVDGIRAGESLTLPATGGAARLTTPDGRTVEIGARAGVWALPPMRRAGFYRLETPAGERWIAVNAAAGESAIAPRDGPGPSGGAARSAPGGLVEIWPWLVAAAALLSLGEWYLFARRRVAA